MAAGVHAQIVLFTPWLGIRKYADLATGRPRHGRGGMRLHVGHRTDPGVEQLVEELVLRRTPSTHVFKPFTHSGETAAASSLRCVYACLDWVSLTGVSVEVSIAGGTRVYVLQLTLAP